MEKHYIGATELLEDSFKLAWEVYESGYRPNYIVGVWRGGAPIGIAVQELFDVLGVNSDHIAIRTSYYSGMDQRNDSVQVYGLSYLIKKLESEDSLLIVFINKLVEGDKPLGKAPLLSAENIIFITSPTCRVEFDPKSKVVKEIVLFVKSISDCLNVVTSCDFSRRSNNRLKSSNSLLLLKIPFFSA